MVGTVSSSSVCGKMYTIELSDFCECFYAKGNVSLYILKNYEGTNNFEFRYMNFTEKPRNMNYGI